MKIQKIKTYDNLSFRRKEVEVKNNDSFDCRISEYEEDNRKRISFSFDKERVLNFFRTIFCNKKKNKTMNFQIGIDSSCKTNGSTELTINEIQTGVKETIPSEKLSFPAPKFLSNPTTEQRDEYINSIAGLIYDKDGQVRKQTLQMIKKYGINDVTRLQDCFDDSSEENVRLTLKIFTEWGKNDDVFAAIDPICRSKIKITEDETFMEVLKTIQKLAHLDKETPKDREIIIEPVRKLLNHKSEQVRKMAQETIDIITPKNK